MLWFVAGALHFSMLANTILQFDVCSITTALMVRLIILLLV
jgi:hypothetical protein